MRSPPTASCLLHFAMLSLAESLAAAGYAFLAWFAYELWYHRDGSAIGCYYRPYVSHPLAVLIALREQAPRSWLISIQRPRWTARDSSSG